MADQPRLRRCSFEELEDGDYIGIKPEGYPIGLSEPHHWPEPTKCYGLVIDKKMGKISAGYVQVVRLRYIARDGEATFWFGTEMLELVKLIMEPEFTLEEMEEAEYVYRENRGETQRA